MMHRCCSSSQGHVTGTCTCGMFHGQTNSYPMLFSMPNQNPYDDYESDVYSFTPSSSSVDCTLSLGTPSTRLTEDEEKRTRHDRRSSVTNFCWDILQSKHNPQSQNKSNKGSNGNNNNNNHNDPLLARRCANCDTTSTPLWRNGPRGPKSLCNACGIRFKKEERRASAAAAAAATTAVAHDGYSYQNNNSWYAHSQVHDSDRDSENGVPFLSWRLNVADRTTSLVHDFTR
ncbi:GATA transcription factor 18-like [Gastrolobium bilobum]|uniref:GATA transcription factor 18-like n=1 Tax=Gastrolobium bilobum TaxID=150636 RepID=UPI002AB209B1|nr:GATA transcription factor 18-like [Gastrolobium bilobum]